MVIEIQASIENSIWIALTVDYATTTITVMNDEDEDEEEDFDNVNIVIEGPVTAINLNIITIYNIDIQVEPADDILNEIQIGDILHVDGTMDTSSGTVIIIAINIQIVNIVININPSSGNSGSSGGNSGGGGHDSHDDDDDD